jgi:phosphatidylglycerophosphate synthase
MAFSEKSTLRGGLGKDLQRWTEWHAAAVGAALLGVLCGLPIAGFPIAAAISFAALIWRFRTQWTPSGRFGPANAITLFRLTLVLALFALIDRNSGWIGPAALFAFALDAADGWVARRYNLAADFGEFFDKEVDAFFLLALCLLLYTERRLGLWVLVPGVLRYLFVVYLKLAEPRPAKEERNRFGCWSYFLMMLALISGFVIDNKVHLPLILLMTCVLCASFADTIRRLHQNPRRQT